MTRSSNRQVNELRTVEIETGYNPYAEGSCLIKMGNTHVLCTATVETNVPPFLRGKGEGWVTAEYGMLPRSTHSRMQRKKAAESGRTQEIQRLIGRSLRAIVDTKAMGETQIRVDCDVIQADGGTRTASITGAYVAIKLAEAWMKKKNLITTDIVREPVSAVSCGIYEGTPVLDLDYVEDSNAGADTNFILTASGGIVEIQGTAEDKPFSRDEFNALFELAEHGCKQLFAAQQIAIEKALAE